jgi:hypothetical protein
VSSQPPSQPPRRTSVSEQRAKRQQGKPNRSQVRAAQTRASQQTAKPATTTVVQEVVPETGATQTVVRTRRLTQAQRRAIERGGVARGSGLPTGVVPLTRAEEMAMVREDMNRLLIIAGILLVGMIALLLVID